MIQRITKVAQAFDPFLDLNHSSQSALLKMNADLLVSLRGAVFFEDKKKGLDQILYSMGVDDVEIGKKLLTTALQNVGEMNRIDYRNFNSLQKIESGTEKESRYFIRVFSLLPFVNQQQYYLTRQESSMIHSASPQSAGSDCCLILKFWDGRTDGHTV